MKVLNKVMKLNLENPEFCNMSSFFYFKEVRANLGDFIKNYAHTDSVALALLSHGNENGAIIGKREKFELYTL